MFAGFNVAARLPPIARMEASAAAAGRISLPALSCLPARLVMLRTTLRCADAIDSMLCRLRAAADSMLRPVHYGSRCTISTECPCIDAGDVMVAVAHIESQALAVNACPQLRAACLPQPSSVVEDVSQVLLSSLSARLADVRSSWHTLWYHGVRDAMLALVTAACVGELVQQDDRVCGRHRALMPWQRCIASCSDVLSAALRSTRDGLSELRACCSALREQLEGLPAVPLPALPASLSSLEVRLPLLSEVLV